MSDLPKMVMSPLTEAARKAISAHTAVREEIATHAEKAKELRHEAYHKLEIQRGIKPTGRT